MSRSDEEACGWIFGNTASEVGLNTIVLLAWICECNELPPRLYGHPCNIRYTPSAVVPDEGSDRELMLFWGSPLDDASHAVSVIRLLTFGSLSENGA